MRGTTREFALSELKALGVAVEVHEARVNQTALVDTVIEQQPAPGVRAQRVTLHVGVNGKAADGTQRSSAVIHAPVSIAAGAAVELSWSGPNKSDDRIALVPARAPDDVFFEKLTIRADQPMPAKLPSLLTPGLYELRYFQQGTILARRKLVVTPVSATLTCPDHVEAGAEFEVTWKGPGNHSDQIVLVHAQKSDGLFHPEFSIPSGAPQPAVIRAPSEAGSYELRYHLDGLAVDEKRTPIIARRRIEVRGASAVLAAPGQVDAGATFEVDPSSKVYALVCIAPTHCSLWRRGVTDDAMIEPIAGTDLDWRPRGLAMDRATDTAVPCVFGAKLACFDGQWREQLVPPDGVEIIDVALDRAASFAIGTQTNVWIRTDEAKGWRAQWLAPPLDADIELSRVSVSGRYGAAFGTQGEVLGFEENLSWLCQWSSELALVSPGSALDRINLVTKEGRVLRRSKAPNVDFCESQQLDAGAILFSGHMQCGASDNMWLASEHEVWGEFTCIEVP